ADIQPVTKTTDIVAEDVIPLQPRRHKKRKTIVADVGEPPYPPKRLKEDREVGSPCLRFSDYLLEPCKMLRSGVSLFLLCLLSHPLCPPRRSVRVKTI
ncbi:hypothetical protein Tco_0402268, partial [Tanacetum coccineum]